MSLYHRNVIPQRDVILSSAKDLSQRDKEDASLRSA